MTEKEVHDDRLYFINKALTCCYANDISGAILALRKLKLMEDALITYRLSKVGL